MISSRDIGNSKNMSSATVVCYDCLLAVVGGILLVRRAGVNWTEDMCGSFPNSGARIHRPESSRALITRTPTKRTPQFIETDVWL